MKSCLAGSVLLWALTLCPLPSMAAENSSTNAWKLVWADEFDKPGMPDTNKWTYEVGMLRNHESQYYTKGRKENARVENGHLILEARKESYEKAEYTSASLTTKGKASWTRGRIEISAKLPQGRGLWPALWMLGIDQKRAGWPACGELDIMEHVGFDPDTVYANVHTRKYNHTKGTGRGSKIKITEPYKEFHVYAMEWFEDRLDFYLDKQLYFTCKNDGGGEDSWPFETPEYLIMNIAIGGAWGGQKGIDDSIFPQKMEIDYVRIYQKQ